MLPFVMVSECAGCGCVRRGRASGARGLLIRPRRPKRGTANPSSSFLSISASDACLAREPVTKGACARASLPTHKAARCSLSPAPRARSTTSQSSLDPVAVEQVMHCQACKSLAPALPAVRLIHLVSSWGPSTAAPSAASPDPSRAEEPHLATLRRAAAQARASSRSESCRERSPSGSRNEAASGRGRKGERGVSASSERDEHVEERGRTGKAEP